MKPLCLLPEPASIDLSGDSYQFGSAVSILLSSAAESGEWVAATGVQAALAARGISASIQPCARRTVTAGAVVLGVAGRDGEVFPDLTESPIKGGASPTEAYRLSVSPDGIVVAGASSAGLAHGSRTLVQLLDGSDPFPCLTVLDAPAMRWRGIMLDISRGKVPTLSTLQRIVDLISAFKLNMLQLYMEHTFAFPSHPQIGAGWGAMTAEEVKTLDWYCRERYVELVPCFQSLGHHRRLLTLSDYAYLAYSPEDWTLTPSEETWRLLEELYDDFLPCFSSPFVNVCCDEPYDLTHTSAQTHEAAIGYADGPTSQPRDPAFEHGAHLYLQHVQRLQEILHDRGHTMMLWDDIFQQAPELLAALSPDTIYLSWFYEAADEYRQVETLSERGLQGIVCPGTSTWNSLFARIENARANIRGFVRSGLRAGSRGALTTDWGDDGHPNFLGASWYGYAYGASESWSPERLADEEFDRRFALIFFGVEEGDRALQALRLLSTACTLEGINKINGSCTRAMFFRDPLTDDVASLAPEGAVETMESLATRALAILNTLGGLDDERSLTIAEMRLAARQIVHAARKTRWGRRLMELTDRDVESRRAVHADLVALKRDLHELRREYERLWTARNRPEGLWLTLDQFDVAASVIDRWRSQVAPRYRHKQ